MTTGEQITKQAFDDFDEWCRLYDPDGDWDILERIERYIIWWDDNCKLAAELKA